MLSAYEDTIYFYQTLHDRYKWTQEEIDNTELFHLLDLMIVQAKINNTETEQKQVFIDDLF